MKIESLAKWLSGRISLSQSGGEETMAKAPLPEGLDAEALQLPAVFVNHMQISRLGPSLVRISFGEAPAPNAPFYRSAVLMTVEDARTLVDTLVKALNAPMPQPSPATLRY